MVYIFLDTNIFLHFRFFVEIPWRDIVGGDFNIIIAPIVLDEIDKHKRHTNPKIANRAKQVLSMVEKISNGTESFPLSCMLARPRQATFEAHQLDRAEQDDSILAAIIEFSSLHPSDRICLISHDTGPRLRAVSLSIEAFGLSEDYLLAQEKSAEQKQIEKLKAENAQLKHVVPKVSLLFKNGKEVFEWTLKTFAVDVKAEVIKLMTQEELRLPRLIYEDPEIKRAEMQKSIGEGNFMELFKSGKLGSIGISGVSEKQVEQYNKELDLYFMEYRKYLGDRFKDEKLRTLSVPIDICLHNTGNTPAQDIDIWLHFPDGFSLRSVKDFPKKPKPPLEPYLPKNRWDVPSMFPGLGHMFNPGLTSSAMPDIDLGAPDIRKTNSYEVDIYRKSLKHFQSDHLGGLILTFDSFEAASGFTIDYRLSVGNIPSPVSGQLQIKLIKK